MGAVESARSPLGTTVGGRRTAANTSTNNTGNELHVREGEFRQKRVRSRGTLNSNCRTDHRRAKRSIGVRPGERCEGEGRAVAEALHDVHTRPPPRPFRSYATWTTATVVVSNTKDQTVNTVTADRLPPPAIAHRAPTATPVVVVQGNYSIEL